MFDLFFIFHTSGIKYDAEKEGKQFLEARQRELQRIEAAKQKVADQGKENVLFAGLLYK